jgi:hypothetical protein
MVVVLLTECERAENGRIIDFLFLAVWPENGRNQLKLTPTEALIFIFYLDKLGWPDFFQSFLNSQKPSLSGFL